MLILVNRFNSEERIDFIFKQISNDPAYYVLNKYNRRRQIIQQYGFMDIAIAANNVVNTYANFTFNEPMKGAFGGYVFFRADKRHIEREGNHIAAAKYASHFVTCKNTNSLQRHYDYSKIIYLGIIGQAIQNACYVYLSLNDNNEKRLNYIYTVSPDNNIKIVCEPYTANEKIARVITAIPNQKNSEIIKKNTPIEYMGVKPHD